jgi:glyceraldehyde 3-phosphate dehydrogenase
MGTTRIAINGFGRIGRIFTRALYDQNTDIKIVAINDLTDAHTLAHLLRYDSVHGRFNGKIESSDSSITIHDDEIQILNKKNPEELPWANMDIDFVIESTGIFRDRDGASKHLRAGAKKVIISAPAKSTDIKAVVMGINHDILDGSEKIVSNASCTTNCAAPLVKVLKDLCGIENAYITTIHSYTGDQRLHDAPHSDLRRARAAAESIVPTTTGAAKAITKIFPELDGKMGGCGIRVPVPDGSLTDITCVVENAKTVEEINQAFKKASENELKGVLGYTDHPIVSRDIISQPESCIFDAQLTSVIDNLVKVVGWYDNEAGYSNRLVDLVKYMNKL